MLARLATFGGVYPFHLNPFAVYLYRVSVNDARLASQGFGLE